MSQIIVYKHTKADGFEGIAVCTPTDGTDINYVLSENCPEGAIIVDDSTLPQGADAQFFDAWELANGQVSVNFAKAQAQKLAQFNASAVQVAQARQLNTLAGIANAVADADFTASLTAGRTAIANATTTADLVAVANPV